MNYDELINALQALEKERGIPIDYMVEKIVAGIQSALRKDLGGAESLSVVIDDEKREIRLVQKRTVVEDVEHIGSEISLEQAKTISPLYTVGDVVEEEISLNIFGRISAQNAKQVIIQGIREYEREVMFQEYQSKQFELLNCVVARIDRRGASLDVGKHEVYLINNEQIPGETLKEGMRIKVYVVEVRNAGRGPQIMISRTHPGLVHRLFEMEIPEVQEGIVEIKSISREAGSRCKVAVHSHNPNVDPVGACIGTRGSRISVIVDELRGERIDVVQWHENPLDFVAEALSPAEVLEVEEVGHRACRVIVPDDQLSLAIGKEGQNARLAAKLTGWKIDIKPESAPIEPVYYNADDEEDNADYDDDADYDDGIPVEPDESDEAPVMDADESVAEDSESTG